MTSTDTITANPAGPSPDLVRTGQRIVLLAAVQRTILCPYTALVLDVRTAVYVDLPSGGYAVMTGQAWDQVAAAFLTNHPDADVIDGRTL